MISITLWLSWDSTLIFSPSNCGKNYGLLYFFISMSSHQYTFSRSPVNNENTRCLQRIRAKNFTCETWIVGLISEKHHLLCPNPPYLPDQTAASHSCPRECKFPCAAAVRQRVTILKPEGLSIVFYWQKNKKLLTEALRKKKRWKKLKTKTACCYRNIPFTSVPSEATLKEKHYGKSTIFFQYLTQYCTLALSCLYRKA